MATQNLFMEWQRTSEDGHDIFFIYNARDYEAGLRRQLGVVTFTGEDRSEIRWVASNLHATRVQPTTT
jgi:hypothetical protein